jgi:glycosyltransferase involved in cell wall biosynthesis
VNLVFAIKSLNVPGGGAERVLVELANYLVSHGHQVTVVTFDSPDGQSFYSLDPLVARRDLAIGPPGHPTPRLGLLKSLLNVRRVITQVRPDLVVGFMHSMYVPLAVALLGSGLRIVASEHVGFAHFKTRPIQMAMIRLVDSLFVAKTIPSEKLKSEHPPELQKKVQVLANPVSLAQFEGVASRQPESPPIVLCVGRFMEEKNQSDLIRAFAIVVADFPEWRLRLVGDGVQRKQLEALIAQLGIQNLVSLPGVTNNVAEEYARASLVVVPSWYESFGMVAAEALASGRAVLGLSECDGIRDLIHDGENGLLVEGGSDCVSSLSAGLKELMGDEELRIRLASAGPMSVENYASDRVLSGWEAFLKQCVLGEFRG